MGMIEYMSPLNGRQYMENEAVVNVADSYANNTVGFEKFQVLQVAKSLLPTAYNNAVKAIITVEGSDVRCRTDGTAPTVDTGLLVRIDTVIVLNGFSEITKFKVIAITGTSILNIEYKG